MWKLQGACPSSCFHIASGGSCCRHLISLSSSGIWRCRSNQHLPLLFVLRAHNLCQSFCKVYAFILPCYWLAGSPRTGIIAGIGDEASCIPGRFVCCFLFCKAVLLAIAQVSCLLAQAMEGDLAFPFRSRAYGRQLRSLRNLHSLDTASAWGWAGGLPKAQRIPEMVMSGCRTLDVWHSHCHMGVEQASGGWWPCKEGCGLDWGAMWSRRPVGLAAQGLQSCFGGDGWHVVKEGEHFKMLLTRWKLSHHNTNLGLM